MFLKAIKIENARCFRQVDFSFLRPDGRPRRLTMLVGRNGSGKSSFLRAIALGLCHQKEGSALVSELAGHFIRQKKTGRSEDVARIELELLDPFAPERELKTITTVRRDASGQEYLEQTTEPESEFPWAEIFVCGYGVNRGGRQRESRAYYSRHEALKSLFNDDTTLLEPEMVLRTLKLDDFEQGRPPGAGLLDDTLRRLRKILLLDPKHRVEVGAQQVTVHGPWGAMPFHALGDGYRGTAGWLIDLLGQSLQAGKLPAPDSLSGIVLIDEIDEHVHPSWQRELVQTVTRCFPKIQLVGTTHSALSIVNCEREELAVADLQDAIATVQPQDSAPEGHTVDQILREWFGLSSTVDRTSERLLTRYRTALERGEPVEHLREQIRARLGYMVLTPLDELAVKIAAEVRRDLRGAASEETRQRLVKEAAARARAQLAEAGS